MDNRIEIYKDEDMTVEIDKVFFTFYDKYYIKFFRMNPFVNQFYIGFIAEVLMDKGMATPESMMVCSQRVYVLNNKEVVELEEPFDIFNDAFKIVSLAEDFSSYTKEIESQIMEHYNSKDFYCEIFDRPVFGVRGFFTKLIDDKAYVIFFAYEEDE